MTDRLIRIKDYEQAADEKVSIGGIKWQRKWDVCIQCDSREEAEALRARLAQPEPEPVAWYYAGSDVECPSIALDADLDDAQKANCTPLYTAPPQRKWQGLTDEEIRDWWRIENGLEDCNMAELVDFTLAVRAIEAKLKEKNA